MIKFAIRRIISSVWTIVFIEHEEGCQILVHDRATNLGHRAEVGYSVPHFNIVEDTDRNAIALEIFNDVDNPVPDKILAVLNSARVFDYPNKQKYGNFLSAELQAMLLANLLEESK